MNEETSLYNLIRPVGTATGVADRLYIAPAEWFNVIECPRPPYTVPGDRVNIYGDHYLKPGLGFLQIELAPWQNQFSAKEINEKPSATFEQVLTVFVPGSYTELHETFSGLMNRPLVALIRDGHCGTCYQLGTDFISTYLTGDFTTATARDGRKGYECRIVFVFQKIMLYNGLIQVYEEGAGSLSSVFLMPLEVGQLSGGSDDLEQAYAGALTTDISQMYTVISSNADAAVIQIAFANDTETANGFLVFTDLSSEQAFITQLYTWLEINSQNAHMEVKGSQLGIYDPGMSKSFMGIALPSGILGNNDYILSTDNFFLSNG